MIRGLPAGIEDSSIVLPATASAFLKWAGGKRQLLSDIIAIVPDFDNYIEPFLGGGAVFFALSSARPKFHAILGDANSLLIETYQVVRDVVEPLIVMLSKYEHKYRVEPAKFYYSLRASNPADPLSRAARLIALNRTCYNGLYRVNSKGQFNVPIGRYKNPKICNPGVLRAASYALSASSTELFNGDFEKVALAAKQGDFIYLDPPFVPESSTANFVTYTRSGFGPEEQVRLAKVFSILDARGCFVLLSNSDTPLVRELYSGFSDTTTSVPALRSINSDSSGRSRHRELLIRNYKDCRRTKR